MPHHQLASLPLSLKPPWLSQKPARAMDGRRPCRRTEQRRRCSRHTRRHLPPKDFDVISTMRAVLSRNSDLSTHYMRTTKVKGKTKSLPSLFRRLLGRSLAALVVRAGALLSSAAAAA
eukprot:6181433-Pleurochrysis_carterae.AAC.2